jgi:polysaccharide pyruvyl transferase WcaK-like protein
VTSDRSKSRKVLLIGAYANGNVGDMYQAEAIAGELLAVDPELSISSASPSKRAMPYPAANHTALPADTIRDFDALNAFDVILVGGGGLLAAPHVPLHEDAWVQGIDTRLCAVSLGCASKAAEDARTFIERCDRFSVRDEFSVQEVGAIRDDIDVVMDPILLGEISDERPAGRQPGARGIACVAGKLLPNTQDFYRRLEEDILTSGADVIVSVNEGTDRRSGFDEVFTRPVTYARSVVELQDCLATHSYCLSERYHGCILALRWSVPCFGIALRSATVTSKITELYRKLGLSQCVIRNLEGADRASLTDAARHEFDFRKINATLADERLKLRTYLRSCLN